MDEIQELDIAFIKSELVKNDGKDFPKGPGIYFFIANKDIKFSKIEIHRGDKIYIGKSKSLSNRKVNQHFSYKGSGSSTLRRTIGAILKENTQLSIQCFLRSKGKSKQDVYCYIFNEKGEEEITKWMKENLRSSFCETEDIEKAERIAISHFKPILNISQIGNPVIKNLRSECRKQAETNGFIRKGN